MSHDREVPGPDAAADRPPIPAAEYVRMSTEHQQYSTENQRDAIREYARRRGFTIVRTYADEGKSGLRIEGRDALRRLIDDVQAGRADYRAVLVFDVSRWGRFQDTDESAYYEYVCKRAGIQVAYCAEQFENDGSPTATIIKSVKRAMAGEYSRELSNKVFQGQCRLIQLGYRQGGPAGFGLRRMLVDAAGTPKGVLARGDHKSLQTDRVILVPGPAEEVEVVRWIYRAFTREGKRESEIAQALRDRGVEPEPGRQWTRAMVHQVLTNEKYVGHNVYNRRSFKLKRKRVANPPDMWVRSEGAFEAVVDPEAFFVARGILHERGRRLPDEEMVERLRRLLVAHSRLSAALIDACGDDTPCSSAYRHRFGSLLAAYRLAGYVPERDLGFLEVDRRLRAIYPELMDDAVRQLRAAGARVDHDDGQGGGGRLLVNNEFRAAVVVTRCRRTPAGSLRWVLTFDRDAVPDVTVVVRMDVENERPADYFLLPILDLGVPRLRLGEHNGVFWDTYRFDTLNYLARLSGRARIEVAA